jgi:diguanylate cyclase (GGDEF)-like protein
MAHQEGRKHELSYIDLDQFKIVNDTCGHIAGDELLKQVALMLKDCVREADILARLGGDEFGMLLENCDMTQARRIAGEMLEAIHEFRFNWMDKTFEIGASIGLVSINAGSRSAAELMSCADVACYMAKDMGRNRIHEYRIEDADLAKRHGEMHWVAAITKALHESRFRLYGQNIATVGPDDEERRRYEVLVRMLDENGEVVAPGAFIPAAERYNLMPAIDRWVVERVLTSLSMQHRNGGVVLPMTSINLSGTTINEESFLVFVKRRVKELGIPPGTVCFEITETAAIANLNTAVNFMSELKEFGIRFSLDDFGSGLSSFAYLKTLPVDFLKIDGSFIKDIVHDPIDYAIVDAINKIGHVMRLKTIAEFVENEAIFETLKTLGVDFAQGFWLHQPEPLATIDP